MEVTEFILTQYLEEKRLKREARKKFVQEVFGDAWRKMQKRKSLNQKS